MPNSYPSWVHFFTHKSDCCKPANNVSGIKLELKLPGLLKNRLTTRPILIHYDPNLSLCVPGDTSALGIFAAIFHVIPDGTTSCSCSCILHLVQEWAELCSGVAVILFNTAHLDYLPLSATDFVFVTRHDPIVSKVIQYTKRRWSDQVPNVFYSCRKSDKIT